MKVTGIFSTPVLETTLDNVDTNVLEYVKTLPFQFTNDKCCEYSVSKKLHNDPFFSDLFEDVKKVAIIYAREVLGFDLSSPDFVIDMKTSWSIKMKPGDFAGAHYHGQSLFSGILYLKTDKNGSNKLNIIRPGRYNRVIDMKISNWNLHNCSKYFVTPTDNMLVFFPSEIDHSADINESNETLYCLVFDFFPRGILEKNSTSELILNW